MPLLIVARQIYDLPKTMNRRGISDGRKTPGMPGSGSRRPVTGRSTQHFPFSFITHRRRDGRFGYAGRPCASK